MIISNIPANQDNASRYILAFSGGYDSTAMAIVLLEKGHKVDLMYVEGGQHTGKIAAEKICAAVIAKELKTLYPDQVQFENTAFGEGFYRSCMFGSTSKQFGALLPYFTALLWNTPNDHTAAILSMVADDQVTCHAKDLSAAWENLWATFRGGMCPPLMTPFVYSYKEDLLIHWLDSPKVKHIFSLCWTCELPETTEKPAEATACGGCLACRTLKGAIHQVELRGYKEEADWLMTHRLVTMPLEPPKKPKAKRKAAAKRRVSKTKPAKTVTSGKGKPIGQARRKQ